MVTAALRRSGGDRRGRGGGDDGDSSGGGKGRGLRGDERDAESVQMAAVLVVNVILKIELQEKNILNKEK